MITDIKYVTGYFRSTIFSIIGRYWCSGGSRGSEQSSFGVFHFVAGGVGCAVQAQLLGHVDLHAICELFVALVHVLSLNGS